MNGSFRMGILGGTFDPIHLGHLDVAAAARGALDLTEVVFVPSRVPPHRQITPSVSEHHRFDMVALAIAGEDAYRTDDLELSRDEPSYTSVTLETLGRREAHPSQLFFITGADTFEDIASWHDYPDVLNLGHFIVVSRPGHQASEIVRGLPSITSRVHDPRIRVESDLPKNRTCVFLVDAKTRNVSSSDIRTRLANSQSVDGLVPATVAEYIDRHRLYGGGNLDGNLHG